MDVDDGGGSISYLGSTYAVPDEAGDDATPAWLTGAAVCMPYVMILCAR